MPLPFEDIYDQGNISPFYGSTNPTSPVNDLILNRQRRQSQGIANAARTGIRPPDIPIEDAPFQTTIPDQGEFGTRISEDLLRQSREGLGREYGRASFILGGAPIAEEFNLAQRDVQARGALQSTSGSGFARQRVQELELGKQKALNKLRLGIEGQNEEARRAALDELSAIEEQNKQFQRGLENQRRLEQLQGAQRAAELQRGFTVAEREGGGGLFGSVLGFGLNLALPGIGRALANEFTG